MESLTLQPIARVDGTINLPGSKSVSNRALLLAALANGTTVLSNLLDSDDVRHMLNALKRWAFSTRCQTIVPVVKSPVTAAHYIPLKRWSFSWVTPVRRCVLWPLRCVLGATILC